MHHPIQYSQVVINGVLHYLAPAHAPTYVYAPVLAPVYPPVLASVYPPIPASVPAYVYAYASAHTPVQMTENFTRTAMDPESRNNHEKTQESQDSRPDTQRTSSPGTANVTNVAGIANVTNVTGIAKEFSCDLNMNTGDPQDMKLFGITYIINQQIRLIDMIKTYPRIYMHKFKCDPEHLIFTGQWVMHTTSIDVYYVLQNVMGLSVIAVKPIVHNKQSFGPRGLVFHVILASKNDMEKCLLLHCKYHQNIVDGVVNTVLDDSIVNVRKITLESASGKRHVKVPKHNHVK
jgi:hypothetical protein